MNKRYMLFALAFAVPLLVGGPAVAQEAGPARGQVRMTLHTHSAGTLLFPTQRLPFNFTRGDTFSYSSRLCSGNAPFNDLGLDFTPDYPGVDEGDGVAPSRHHIEGTVIQASGNRGVIRGTFTTVLCVPGPNGTQVESPHVIVSNFTASYVRESDNTVRLTGAFQFSPTESTGTFRDLQGGGRFEGRITCLGSSSCAPIGSFTDFVVSSGNPSLPAGQLQHGLTGSYYDPTVLPVA